RGERCGGPGGGDAGVGRGGWACPARPRLDEERGRGDVAADLDETEPEPRPERVLQLEEVLVREEVVLRGLHALHRLPVEGDEGAEVRERVVEEGAVADAQGLLDLRAVARGGGLPERFRRAREIDGERGAVLDDRSHVT